MIGDILNLILGIVNDKIDDDYKIGKASNPGNYQVIYDVDNKKYLPGEISARKKNQYARKAIENSVKNKESVSIGWEIHYTEIALEVYTKYKRDDLILLLRERVKNNVEEKKATYFKFFLSWVLLVLCAIMALSIITLIIYGLWLLDDYLFEVTGL
jgi:hypothetical protein